MIKKLIFSLFLFLVPLLVWASDNKSFAVGNKFYDTLEEAILNATSNDMVELFSNAELKSHL